MTKTLADITKAIGATPLSRLNRIARGLGTTVFAKLEFQNPVGSVKDGIGMAMIEAEAAEAKRLINPETILV